VAPTKQELADSLTIAQLKKLAGDNELDLEGASQKDEIAERVAASRAVSAEALQAAADGGDSRDADADRPPGRSEAEAAAAGASPADLELSSPAMPPGEPIVVKSSPEMPSQAQVDAATSEVAGPPVTAVTLTDADGGTIDRELPPDTAATLAQRVASENPEHPAFTSEGHWSNPNFPRDMTDEEREKDQAAYASRFGK
jgi:hypothetical protein